MPIRINLLAEAQAAEEMRRRDPVKRAIFIGIALAALSMVWSGIVELEVIVARGSFSNVQSEINAKTNAYQVVMAEQKKSQTIQTKLVDLQKLQACRFLQGTLLNALQHATVNDVQMTRLREDQAYVLTPGTESQTTGDQTTPGRPATVREKIILHLDARDYSANPGDKVNKFRETVAKQAYFKDMLDKTNGVQLANPPSSPQFDGPRPYVTFTLDCDYPEVVR